MSDFSRKWLLRSVLSALLPAALAYPADYAVWRLRGSPTEQVQVTRFVVAPLKGGKEEYYPDGSEMVDCSDSMFGQVGAGSCSSVKKHRVVFER